MRLFSVLQWHHFAAMIISLALLGYGASGPLLALLGRWPPRTSAELAARFALCAGLFGASAVATFALAQRIPFNPLELPWDARQLGLLAAVYLLLAVPFLAAASGIGLVLSHLGADAPRFYRADLLGAAIGSVAVLGVLFVLPPQRCLAYLGAAGLAAAAAALVGSRPALAVALLALGALSPFVWPPSWLAPRISPYKALPAALRVPGAEVIAERSSPLGLLTVVRSPQVPLRYAPGLSLRYAAPLPEQLGLFTDGDDLSAIDGGGLAAPELAYLDELPSAVPYHLRARARVAVLGPGGGREIAAALRHGAERVDAVEPDRSLAALLAGPLDAFTGGLYRQPTVRLRLADGRAWIAGSGERYDLIQMAFLDASGPASGALAESYLYTIEAFETYLSRLAPGGTLALTRWLRMPPRDLLKLAATAAVALERRGCDPARHLAVIRTWNAAVLAVQADPLSDADIAALKRFAEDRSFDVAYYPGMPAAEANRFNVLDREYVHEGMSALVGPGRADFLARYRFHLRPATDDRPYFHHFVKWRTLPELWRLRSLGGATLVEWGYLILLATLLQAAAAGAVLILLPLVALAPRGGRPPPRVALYFAALGLAFLFLEIGFLQRFVLYLGHPVYAAAAALGGFLAGAGLGSGAARRWGGTAAASGTARGVRLAVTGIAALALLDLFALPAAMSATLAWPGIARGALAVALITPLAICMGAPFPLALARLAATDPGWIPWAWGVNGWASVVSAVLATLIAVHFGFAVVVVLAVALYGVAAWAATALDGSSGR